MAWKIERSGFRLVLVTTGWHAVALTAAVFGLLVAARVWGS